MKLSNNYLIKMNREKLLKENPDLYNAYKVIMEEQFELFCKKQLDYGIGNIAAGTNLKTEQEKQFALTGLWYRISDKINRWKNLIVKKRKPENETIIDTFQDIANYAIISQIVYQDKWKD